MNTLQPLWTGFSAVQVPPWGQDQCDALGVTPWVCKPPALSLGCVTAASALFCVPNSVSRSVHCPLSLFIMGFTDLFQDKQPLLGFFWSE